MNKFCVLFSVLFCSLTLYGQGLKISEVKETISGTDAFHAPTDKNGFPCGLIKVQSVIPDLSFRGDVVGEVEYFLNGKSIGKINLCADLNRT